MNEESNKFKKFLSIIIPLCKTKKQYNSFKNLS